MDGHISIWFVLMLMFAAYMQNTCYSLTSRAGNRNSSIYYAFTMMLSSLVFFATLSMLVSKNMTLVLWIPYTVATVLGSISGAALSMKVERWFRITTIPDKVDKKASKSKTAQISLLVVMGILILLAIILAKRSPMALLGLAGLAFMKDASFTAVRRSRNTNNAVYHALISVVDGVLWYFMWKELVMAKLSFDLFPPYLFGSVLGGMTGQKISMSIEKMLGTTADSHLERKDSVSPLVPAAVLFATGLAFAFVTGTFEAAYLLMILAVSQNISFALVSRARSRNNFAYHAIASIFSNGVWYLTFRYLTREQMPLILLTPYVALTITGSLIGVTVSMAIEKWLHITSDSHVLEKAAVKT